MIMNSFRLHKVLSSTDCSILSQKMKSMLPVVLSKMRSLTLNLQLLMMVRFLGVTTSVQVSAMVAIASSMQTLTGIMEIQLLRLKTRCLLKI